MTAAPVVSAAAACSPPAPMKHFVNESSDMGFSLEVFPMGGVLMMSISDQEYGASLDLQQLCPFRTKFRFVEVGPVEAENPPHTDTGA